MNTHFPYEGFLGDPVAGDARGSYARYGKRAMDIGLALLILPLVAPIIALLWLAVRAQGGGAGFFGHIRVGQGGRAFRCWKIRTMRADAETCLAEHLAANPAAAAQWAHAFKLDNDPRVTPLGRFLRKSSLDELPQIWNVLRGDMSFVGPRPIVAAELLRYGGNDVAYLAQRPGITGIWQVSGRNDLGYDERVRMDVDYLRRRAFGLDLVLMLRTLSVVAAGTGK